MKIIMITFYTMLRHLRDKRVMLCFLILPLLIIALLGNALNYQFTPKSVNAVKVGFVSMDGELHSALMQFLQTEEVAELMNISDVSSFYEGETLIKKGEIESLIYLPVTGTDVQKSVEIYSSNEYSVVFPIVEGFIRIYNLNDTLIRLERMPVTEMDSLTNIVETQIITEGKIPRGIDYYSIATLFQCVALGAIFGVFAVTKDLGNHTNSRLAAAPLRPLQITLGKFAGSTLSLFLICIVEYVVTKFLLKANWDAELWLILLVLLLMSMISVAIGMIIAHLTKNTMVSALLVFFGGTILTFVAGGFSRMEGKVFEFLSRFSPNTYGQDLLFTDIYEGILDHNALYMLLIITGVTFLLTMLTGRRKLV